MFLADLSYKQRKIFLGLAKEIAVLDGGSIDTHERDYMRGLCSEMSLSFNDELTIDKTEIKNHFDNLESKKILLLELVAIGYSNKNYHKEQDKYTDSICKLIDIPLDELREIESLLGQFSVIQNKLVEFIEI